MPRIAARLREALRSPLVWVLAAIAIVNTIGIGWGLPASDGWDSDGVAPRDFLAGMVETFTPGHYFTYPPVHLALLTLVTSPISVIALVRAPSLAPHDVIGEILKTPYMTAIAYVARGVSVAMSLGIVYAMAKIGEELRGKRAGVCAAAVCGVNMIFTYYAHATNLDVPYLFWASLAMLALVRAFTRHEPRRLRAYALFAVLAIGTKDQSAGLFLLGGPAALAGFVAVDPWARANLRTIGKYAAIAVALAALLFLVTDGVIVNPSGFSARVRFLLGSASQDFVTYAPGWSGRAAVLRDSFALFGVYYPLPFAAFALFGAALVFGRAESRSKLAGAAVPLLAALSFTLLFNCNARRTEDRFLLPQMVIYGLYAGLAIEWLIFVWSNRIGRIAARVAVALSFAVALYRCASVDANLLLDPRYDAEAWLAEHAVAGDTVEVHGLNVYLPRLGMLPAGVRAIRVGPEPVEKRNPLPGVQERRDVFDNASVRRSRWIVVSKGWVWRYVHDYAPNDIGRVIPPGQLEEAANADATAFFRGLARGDRGYRLAHKATWSSKLFPAVELHACLAQDVFIYERVD